MIFQSGHVWNSSIVIVSMANLQKSNKKKHEVVSKPKKPNSSRKLFKYSPTKIQAALKAIRNNGMKVQTACNLFGVPRSTIRHKLDGTAPESYGTVGRTSVLGTDIENELVDWILDIAKRGAPFSKDDLKCSIKILCTERNNENPFTDGVPNEKWYTLFMKRHPNVSLERDECKSRC